MPFSGSLKTAAAPTITAPVQRQEHQQQEHQQQQQQRRLSAGRESSPKSLIPVSRWSKPQENTAFEQQQQKQHDPLQQSPPSASERPGLPFKSGGGSSSVSVRDLSVLHRVRSHIEATGGSDIAGSSGSSTLALPSAQADTAALGSRLGNITKPLLPPPQQQPQASQIEDPLPAKLTRWQQRKAKPGSPPSSSLLVRSIEESEPPPPNRKVCKFLFVSN
jgi:hypothetical protein